MAMLRKETHRLQLSMERYTCDDMTSLTYQDLDQLEQQLEHSVNKVRDRKVILCVFFSKNKNNII